MDPSYEAPYWFETLEQQMANLPRGAHLCHIYSSADELMRVVVPYCREGIARNQQCVFFAPPAGVDDLLGQLRSAGVDLDEALRRMLLLPISPRDKYFRSGQFSDKAMLRYLRQLAQGAHRDGFNGLRITGLMGWMLQTDVELETFLRYDGPGLNEFAANTGTRITCHFPRTGFPPEIIEGVLRTHQEAVIGGHIISNLYFEPPALALDGSPATIHKRVDWMLDRLQRRTRRDLGLADLERWCLAGAPVQELGRASMYLLSSELSLDFAEVFELLRPGGALRRVDSMGWRHPPDGHELWPGNQESRLGGQLVRGRTVIVTDWREERRFEPPAPLLAEHILSSAIAAIATLRGDGLLGVIGAHMREPRTYTDEEVSLLERVANALAYAMDRARTERDLRALLENVPDVIVRFDRELRVVFINAAVESMIGAPFESLLGRKLSELTVPDSLKATWELALRRAWRTGRPQSIESGLPGPSGERFIQLRVVPEFGPDRTVESLLAIARDQTDIRRSETDRLELHRAVVALQERLDVLASRLLTEHDRGQARDDQARTIEHLSGRDRQVLRMLAGGLTNRAIAERLGLTPGSAKNVVSRLLARLGVADRTRAAVRAVELGLLPEHKQE